VRKMLSERQNGQKVKVGHAGTLDPLATGVIILCTGKATKKIEELQSHTKEYVATLKLGSTTASFDLEHEIDATFPTEHITKEMIEEKIQTFVGDIRQIPPIYSAVKIGGRRAYRFARKGEEVKLKEKALKIDAIELLSYKKETEEAKIKVVCGKGTYIRALARDIGLALNSGAHLTSLCRTRIGKFKIEDCFSLESFPEWLKKQTIEEP